MKKIYALLITIIMLFTACQPTPETEVVVGKGEEKIDAMIEKAIDTKQPSTTDGEPELTVLSYDAPEKLEYDIDSDIEGAAMKIRVNAPIILPQYTLPIVKVKPKDIAYEQVSNLLGLVQNGRPLYHKQYAERITLKKDIQHRIDSYMWEIAMCEGEADQEDLVAIRQGQIQQLYEEMESAYDSYSDADIQPEEKAPDIVFVDKDGNKEAELAPEGAFVLTEEYIGPFELTQENFNQKGYSLIIGTGFDADELNINIKKDENFYSRIRFVRREYEGINGIMPDAMTIPGIMDGFEFTQEEALETAQKYAHALDPSLVLTDVSDAIYTDFTKDDNPSFPYGYAFYFGRQCNGVDINYGEKFTWNNEMMEAAGESEVYQRPYPQECLKITVGQKGVQNIEYTSPLEVVETVATNVELLPFDEIIEKFEQYIVLNSWREESTIYMNIERIKLGLMRIAQPDSDEYLVVPVWDFYGSTILSSERTKYTDEEYWDKISHFYGRSFLTINAIDGSIIDREFGY